MRNIDRNTKGVDSWNIYLIKLTVVAVVLFIITIWSAAMDLVHSVNPWYFFVAAIIFGDRPLYEFYLK